VRQLYLAEELEDGHEEGLASQCVRSTVWRTVDLVILNRRCCRATAPTKILRILRLRFLRRRRYDAAAQIARATVLSLPNNIALGLVHQDEDITLEAWTTCVRDGVVSIAVHGELSHG